jgi:hypothetical protein
MSIYHFLRLLSGTGSESRVKHENHCGKVSLTHVVNLKAIGEEDLYSEEPLVFIPVVAALVEVSVFLE